MEQTMLLVEEMPILALRGLTVFPGNEVTVDVGRKESALALQDAFESGKMIFLVAQRNMTIEHPEAEELYEFGTVCKVRSIIKLPADGMRAIVSGICRAKRKTETQSAPYRKMIVVECKTKTAARNKRNEALLRRTYELLERFLENSRQNMDILFPVLASEDPGFVADYAGQTIACRNENKQAMLEELDDGKRLRLLVHILESELAVNDIEKELSEKAKKQMDSEQRNYYLREQLKAIRKELNEDEQSECDEYRQKVEALQLPKDSEEHLLKEIGRLEKQPFGSSEAAVSRNYLDTCLELPWNESSKLSYNLEKAETILNREHYGLEKVKERVLDYLAVCGNTKNLSAPILCLVGPPGVGKTSIASSIAHAMNRKMARVSLGGIHDEAEIRGHRKTYIGAMPGRIIQALTEAGTNNPLLLLDEIDKMGNDQRSDPSAALLEVLDSEQNNRFRDHYIEIPFDLSNVLFVLTANDLGSVPRALRDRMDIIELSSYTEEEKLQICKKHLLPKQLLRHGMAKTQLKIRDDAMRELIASYTSEAGVRNAERMIEKVCRKAIRKCKAEKLSSITVTKKNLTDFLGKPLYHNTIVEKQPEIGLVNGLAWTQNGGTMLQVEAAAYPGSGKVEFTGNLGKVMTESGNAAMAYIRAKSKKLGIADDFYKTTDLHIHFPEGAVPKDGPSAGVTITTAMVSALGEIPVRQDIAMTGEVTIRGRVLPIGGLREKTMAAYCNGIFTVIYPKENEVDLEDIDKNIRDKMTMIPVSAMDEVLEIMCVGKGENHELT